MATTIRLDDQTKRALDRFQAHCQLRRGKRVPHATLIADMLKHFRERGDFFEEDEWRPFTPAEMEALMAHAGSVRSEGSVAEIDEALYSDEAIFGRKRR